MGQQYTGVRDGNKTNEEGANRLFQKLSGTQNHGKIGSGDLAVAQHAVTPNMSVDISLGDMIFIKGNYQYHGWSNDNPYNLAIAASDPTNDRISEIVAYIDSSVVDATNPNSPNGLKFLEVAGTPAPSPVAPNSAAIQTAVGAANVWEYLAEVRVVAAATQILTANITDKRSAYQLGSGIGGISMTGKGVLTVANNISSLVIVPKSGTFSSIYARVKTNPTGADLIGRVNKNGVQVATFDIPAGSANYSNTGLSITFVAGDYFTLDITQIGATIAGSDLTVALG